MGQLLLDMQKINDHYDCAIKNAHEFENGLYHFYAKGKIIPEIQESQLALVLYLDGISRVEDLDDNQLHQIKLIALKTLRSLDKEICKNKEFSFNTRSQQLALNIEVEMSNIMQYIYFDIREEQPWNE
jgi:hypothetical protein